MAAAKRRFTVPSAEDLHGEIQVSRPKPLFNTYKKYCKCIEEKKDDTSTCTTNVNDRKGDEKNDLAARTLHEQSQEDQRIVEVTLDPNQDSLSKESNLEPSENNHTSAAITSAGAGSVKPTVGKTFRETFAFLEDTSHFKETVAKIKEKEYVQLYGTTNSIDKDSPSLQTCLFIRSGYSYGTPTTTCICYSYGSQKISLNFSVIADSSLSKLLYLPLGKISDPISAVSLSQINLRTLCILSERPTRDTSNFFRAS